MAFYTIYPRDIQNICFQKRVRVVDIREPQEYRKYHYPGAVNIPYSDEDSCDWRCKCNAGADKALDGQNHFSWKYFCN